MRKFNIPKDQIMFSSLSNKQKSLLAQERVMLVMPKITVFF